jgi:vacuolar protein sorting-associated protein 16
MWYDQVPEKRFWHIKVKALAASGQWEQLRLFGNEKRSPVGYKPFALAAIQHKQPPQLIEGYIDKITPVEDR